MHSMNNAAQSRLCVLVSQKFDLGDAPYEALSERDETASTHMTNAAIPCASPGEQEVHFCS
jgi:hypothetical protein